MTQTWVRLFVGFALTFASAASIAEPVDIILRQDSNSSGPLPTWSLLLDVQSGYEVGAIGVLVTGLDVFTINTANPGIGPLDSVYVHDPLGDGRNGLIVVNLANGIAIATGPIVGSLLGTLSSPNGQPVAMFDGEYAFGGTAWDTFLSPFAASDVSIRVDRAGPVGAIPESRHLGWISLGIAGLTIAQAFRSRSRAVTPRA